MASITSRSKRVEKKVKLRFTVSLRTSELGEGETLATPTITLPKDRYKIVGLNVYEGKDGEEVFKTKININE